MEAAYRPRDPGTHLRRVLSVACGGLLSVLTTLLVAPIVCAQQGDPTVELAYQRAEALYREDLSKALALLDSLADLRAGDRDQRERTLFLKAITEAQLDSIKAMRRSVEGLFRNHRSYVMKPYDPLLVTLPVKEEVYGTYLGLVGGREVGVGMLQKDHGRWRGGLRGGIILPRLHQNTDRQVFDADGTYTYVTPPGWEALATMEYEIIPNIAVSLMAGYSEVRYRSSNKAVRYDERLVLLPVSLGLHKSFWLAPRSAWVPYLHAGATHAWISTADATIERAGDGIRLLGSTTRDRSMERERSQWRLFGAAGLSRKVGHTVLFVEGRYDHALTDLTRAGAAYTDEELLIRYYHVDNELALSQLLISAGFQYVIRYHRTNRIHP